MKTVSAIKNKFFSILLSAALLGLPLADIPLTVFAQEGSCGSGVTYTVSGDTLTISGSGDMYDYGGQNDKNPAPWASLSGQITNITVKEGVSSIGANAFLNMSAVNSVSLPSTLKKINASAFENCCALKDVSIPDSVLSVGEKAFYMTYNGTLESVRIGRGVRTLGKNAFDMCHMLKSVVFAAGSVLEEIGDSCFAECPQLKSIALPDSVIRIGSFAFQNDTSLSDIRLGAGVENIGTDAFSGTSFEETLINEAVGDFVLINTVLYKYKGKSADIEIPWSVVTINANAFQDSIGVENISLPYTVESLSSQLFKNLSSLKNIKVSKASPYFYDLDGVLFDYDGTLICYPKGRTQSEYFIPEGTKTLVSDAFYECPNLQSLYIPKSVTVAQAQSVSNLRNLKSLFLPFERESDLPSGYATSDNVFERWNLGTVSALGGPSIYYTKFVQSDAYWKIEGEKLSITGSGKVEGLAFAPWKSFGTQITSVVADDTISSISPDIFEDTAWYRNSGDIIKFSNGKRLFKYKGSTDYKVDTGVKELMPYCFNGIEGNISVTVGDNVKTVGNGAFGQNITVRCYENSAAHKYAAENLIPFELIEDFVPGLVSGKEEISMTDAIILFKAAAGIEDNLFSRKNADANNDGIVSLADVLTLLTLLKGKV